MGNISISKVVLSSLDRFSDSALYCKLLRSSISAISLSFSLLPVPRECDGVERSVSSDLTSPCHERARSEDREVLESSSPEVPDGSNAESICASALCFKIASVALSSSTDAGFERS